MLRYRGFQVLCLAVTFLWQHSAAWDLEPPAGFSKSLTTTIDQGKQMYTCDTGIWLKSGSSAYLVTNNPQNGGLVRAGNYESTRDSTTKRSIMKWTILNSPGDAIESGDETSSVTGVAIYSQNASEDAVPEVLFEATSRQGAGAAALVTYIVMTQTKGGQAPHSSLCTEDDTIIDVPFDGFFEFYVQDRQPPPNVPAELKPPARVVQGFFVKGKMVYRFDGMKWHSEGIIATIYNVAGGNVIGKFGTTRKPDQYGSNIRWIVNNPNGFTLTGKITGSRKVSDNGAAWQLYEITSSSGTVTSVGPFKYVQLASTRGGLEPKISGGATLGLLWKSNFTGVCWFYT